jgi:hypothetical protein
MDLMDTAQLLGNFGEFFGSVAILVTLAYLAIQIKTARADVDANTWNSTNSNSISVETAFLQKAEIWAKANAGQPLTADEEFAFDTLISMRTDLAFFGYGRNQALKNDREKYHAITLAIFFSEYPIAHERWLNRAQLRQRLRDASGLGFATQTGFVEVVEEALASMNAASSSHAV